MDIWYDRDHNTINYVRQGCCLLVQFSIIDKEVYNLVLTLFIWLMLPSCPSRHLHWVSKTLWIISF